MKIGAANGRSGYLENGIMRVKNHWFADVMNFDLATTHPAERFHCQFPYKGVKVI
jgi:hypothetical protein